MDADNCPSKATLRRAGQLARAIDILRAAPLLAEQLAERLDVSESGARKYLASLVEDKIVGRREISLKDRAGRPKKSSIYSLIADEDAVRLFVESVPKAAAEYQERHARNIKTEHGIIHSIGNEIRHDPKAERRAVQRDPMDVLLFGPARRSDDPKPDGDA